MPDLSKRLEKAEKYLQKGRQDDALQEYLQALHDDPNNENVRQAAADLALALGRPEAAELLTHLFERQVAVNDATKAIANYKKLARIVTPKFDHVFRYGQLLEKGSKREALDAYNQALQGFAAAGRKADEIAVLKRVVLLDGAEANYTRLGVLASELGDGKTAGSAFLRVGQSQQALGEDPIQWYERAHKMDAASPDIALQYGRCLTAAGRAAEAIDVLAPIATLPESRIEDREAYAKALVAAQRLPEAEPFIWELFERDPRQEDEVGNLIGALLDSDHHAHAVELAQKLESAQLRRGNQREFVSLMKDISDSHRPSEDFLEYMVEVYNAANREHDYCDTLLKLFELYYAGGNFIKAADCLDRAAEVDPYEPGHERRLDLLRGKIDVNYLSAIASRFNAVLKVDGTETAQEETPEGETTVLEDLLLQAEIFLQYSMRSKAVERLERIHKLFPREEEKNEKLRNLYNNSGFTPKYADSPAPAAAEPKAVSAPPAAPPPAVRSAQANESAVDNFARVTEITRNIYRQGSVKGVLFTAVNEIGRHWNASRCVAALVTPGKPPSAHMEYCAPGVEPSPVIALVKFIQGTQNIAAVHGTVSSVHVPSDPQYDSCREAVAAIGVESVLAMPLLDGDEHAGIIILAQTQTARNWRPTDDVVLKTMAEQTVQAVNNARLRSLVKTLAVTEEKSGLLKRSSYLDVLLSETKRAIEQELPLSLMLIQFGKSTTPVRDYGEAAVDAMVQQAGQILTSHIRQADIAVRYELTTIALILADTGEKNAFFVVDKLRKALSSVRLPGKTSPISLTVGIAEGVLQSRFDPVDIVTEMINRAENALEAARTEGPNTVKSLTAPSFEDAGAAVGD